MHADPGDDALDLDRIGARRAALGVGNDVRQDGSDPAFSVFFAAYAFDDIAVFQPRLVARIKPLKALGRQFQKVIALDPDFGAEREMPCAELGQMRMSRSAAGLKMR